MVWDSSKIEKAQEGIDETDQYSICQKEDQELYPVSLGPSLRLSLAPS